MVCNSGISVMYMSENSSIIFHVSFLPFIVLVYSSLSFQSEDDSLAFFHITDSIFCTISFGIYYVQWGFLLFLWAFSPQLILLSPLSLLLACFNSPLLKPNDLCSLICWTNRAHKNTTPNMYFWDSSGSPQQALLMRTPPHWIMWQWWSHSNGHQENVPAALPN